jgi:hypothetical protein
MCTSANKWSVASNSKQKAHPFSVNTQIVYMHVFIADRVVGLVSIGTSTE